MIPPLQIKTFRLFSDPGGGRNEFDFNSRAATFLRAVVWWCALFLFLWLCVLVYTLGAVFVLDRCLLGSLSGPYLIPRTNPKVKRLTSNWTDELSEYV